MRDNFAHVPHISIYNNQGQFKFGGYVGLIHASGLRKEVQAIQQKYCKKSD